MMKDDSIEDLLIAHAAGRLAPPVDFVVAMHLAMTKGEHVWHAAAYGAVGGAMLADLEPTPLLRSSLDAVFRKIEAEPALDEQPASPDSDYPELPEPLRSRIGMALDDVPWREFSGVGEYELGPETDGYRTRLIRLRAGCGVPKHTHRGQEVTLVLRGAFWDGDKRYAEGDLAFADDNVDHQPTADKGGDCICLAVTDAPIRLSGRFTRLLNPILRL